MPGFSVSQGHNNITAYQPLVGEQTLESKKNQSVGCSNGREVSVHEGVKSAEGMTWSGQLASIAQKCWQSIPPKAVALGAVSQMINVAAGAPMTTNSTMVANTTVVPGSTPQYSNAEEVKIGAALAGVMLGVFALYVMCSKSGEPIVALIKPKSENSNPNCTEITQLTIDNDKHTYAAFES